MKRPYAGTVEQENVSAFLGTEVERTPAYGFTTLFLVGLRTIEDIAALVDTTQEVAASRKLPNLRHIFFGANWSFNGEEVTKWATVIEHFLKEGLWCTLDLRPTHIPLILKTSLCRHARFIPLIGVRIPYALLLGSNAVLKVDDIDFSGTNPGVWCHPLQSILTIYGGGPSKCFTGWADYAKDIILET